MQLATCKYLFWCDQLWEQQNIKQISVIWHVQPDAVSSMCYKQVKMVITMF